MNGFILYKYLVLDYLTHFATVFEPTPKRSVLY